MVPARFARRSWPVAMSLEFKPRKFVAVIFGTGMLPTPRIECAYAVAIPPELFWPEPLCVSSKPAWNECDDLIQLIVSANCIKGLGLKRGAAPARPNGA